MLQNAASPPKDRYCVTKSTRILEPRSLQGPSWPCWQSLLPCLHMGLLLNGAFCRSLKAGDLHSPQGWDHWDCDLQSFTFAGKLVVASSKALHLSHAKQHCLPFSWAKTPFLLYNNILLSKYKLSVPLTCQRLSSEIRHQSPF